MKRLRLPATPVARNLLIGLGGLVLVVLALHLLSPFRTGQFANVGVMAVAVAGLSMLTGLSGQISIGHGAFMAIGAYATALLLGMETLSLPVVLALTTVIVTIVGAIVGLAAARFHGPYVAGATIALALAVPGVAMFVDGLGGDMGLKVKVPPAPDWFLDAVYAVTGLDLDRGQQIALAAWVCVILCFVLLANLKRSRVGRVWRAMRDDDVAAELAGINVARERVVAFVLSAACAGLAGGLFAVLIRLAAPGAFTLNLSLLLLCGAVIGGLGSLSGALIGATIVTMLPQLVTQWGSSLGIDDVRAAQIAPLVYGLTVMLVVMLLPGGLSSIVGKWREKRRAAAHPPTAAGAPAAAPSEDQHSGNPAELTGRNSLS